MYWVVVDNFSSKEGVTRRHTEKSIRYIQIKTQDIKQRKEINRQEYGCGMN